MLTVTRSQASGSRRLLFRSGPIPDGTSIELSLASYATATLIPFARTRSGRDAAGDTRPSLEGRYGNCENYVGRVEGAAAALVADRLLLRADAAAYINAARERDRF